MKLLSRCFLMLFVYACGNDEVGNSDEVARQPVGNINAFWEQFDWDEFNAAEQRLWGKLGWNESSWDGDGNGAASESKSWNELTSDEQVAAEQLGYTQASWDA